MKLLVDSEKALELAKKGGKLVLKKEAEKYLVELIELQEAVNEAVKQAKEQIKEAGKAIDTSFKGVIGERIKAIYRSYGAKYTYRMNELDIAKPFLKEKTYYSVDTGAVENYLKATGELPEGIYPKERNKSISFTINNKLLE